ncbi:MAG: FkbM family methyltransferase [Spirochaetia bacterium]
MRRIERMHRVWSPVQSGLAFGSAVIWAVFPQTPAALWSVPAVSMLIFYLLAGRKNLTNIANLVSLARVELTASVFLFQAVLLDRWIILVIILSAVELLDWLDGRVAHRIGPTRFGKLFDEEADAFFTLTVSALLTRTGVFGPWVLTFGALRYLFSVVFVLFPEPAVFPRRFSRYAKTVCAVSAGVLIAGFAEILPPAVRLGAAGLALGFLVGSFCWETVLRIRPLRPLVSSGGLLKSYAVYYLVPGKRYRMRRLYENFLREGDLAFDIGSHLGNRIRVWRDMGVRVLAVEPNPECLLFLSSVYGADERVEIIPAASGAETGRGSLYVDPRNPTLATVSSRWIREVEDSAVFSNIRWKRTYPIRMVTLDELIHLHGTPRFIKIDTEGFDHRVLEGLSTPVENLSFEYLPTSPRTAEEALLRVESLWDYEFNVSRRETMRFRWREWRSGAAIRGFLASLEEGDSAGDVYARRRDTR